MLLTYSAAGNVSAKPMTNNSLLAGAGEEGIITDILITGDDASCDVTIADDTGSVFAKTSLDTTTSGGLKYKSDSADILRSQVTGLLKVTTANNTGTVVARVWRAPVNR